MYADLHIHTQFSDGTQTPIDVIALANEANVTLISITDHDVLNAYDNLPKIDGVNVITGIELDALLNGRHTHVLGYGFDVTNAEIKAIAMRARDALDGMSDELVARMTRDHADISTTEYAAFAENPAMGGWKGIQYLHGLGYAERLEDAARYYPQYGVTYADADFPSAEECVRAIHAAGGRAILAHAMNMYGEDEDIFVVIDEAIACGIDGLECYYPSHDADFTHKCVEYCNKNNLLITAGGDGHGEFARVVRGVKYGIGMTKTLVSALNLGDIHEL